MQDLLDDVEGRSVGRTLGDRLFIDEPCLTILLTRRLPAILTCPCNAEVSTGLGGMLGFFSVFENALFALNIAFVLDGVLGLKFC